MSNNQASQKFNSGWRTYISLVLGIISLILFLFWIVDFWCSISPKSVGCYLNHLFKKIPLELQMIIYLFQIPLFPIIGLIFGILELRSTKKTLAMIGLTLCSISFIGSIILLLIGFLYSLGI
jgi:hypothetical protein